MNSPPGRLARALCSLRGPAFLLVIVFHQSPLSHALTTQKPLKQFGRQSWQSDTGLPQNTVHSILQTQDGFIWIATEGGLVRFDGQDFRVFDQSTTHDLPGDSINSLAEDTEGALWIATSAGLAQLEHGKFRSFTTSQGLPSSVVQSVRSRRSGGIVVSTAAGVAIGDVRGFKPVTEIAGGTGAELITEEADGTLLIASGQRFVSIAAYSSQAAASISVPDIGELRAVAADHAGDVWVGGTEGLAHFQDGTRVTVTLPETAPSRFAAAVPGLSVTAILPVPGGDLWVGTEAGVARYSHGRLFRVGNRPGHATGRVNRLFQDREGAIWAAFDLGVDRILPVEPARPQQSLDVAGVLSFFEDREGDMWFGSEVGGLTTLREQSFSTLTTQDGLSDDFVRAVFQDRAGTVWLGTNRGGLNRIADGTVSALQAGRSRDLPGGLSSNVVLALAETGDGLWIGTPDGLNRLREGSVKRFTTADGLPDDFVRSLYADRDGSLWVGTRNGLSHYSNGSFTSYSRLDGLGSDLIGSIVRTRDARLWVGTLNGLSRFDGETFKTFTERDGLGSNAITALAEDHDGTLWIASHAAGLTRLRAGIFSRGKSATAGLPEEIYSILETGSGTGQPKQTNLWLGSPKGVFSVPVDGLNALVERRAESVPVESYGTGDGMRISECSSGGHPAAWRMRDGSLWFATLKGAASISSPDLRSAGSLEASGPPAAVEEVTIDDQPAGGGDVVVPPGHGRLAIHYAGLSFAAPQKVRFRYMLEGFDRDWIAAGSRRTAYYTNVPPGRYRFLVYASVRDVVWSAVPGELKVTVKPRFYQMAWFYLVAGLALLSIAYLIFRLRVGAVKAQYSAVLAERNRIAREIHDTLAQGYVGVSVQLEMVSRLLKGAAPQKPVDAAVQQLEATKDLVRSSLAEARSSIWNLRWPGAESDTLPARLAATVESRQRESNGMPAISLEVQGSFRPAVRRVEDEVLRIGQEAISNALRHADARHIAIVLSYDTSRLRLAVVDDGKGFDPAKTISPGHYGLQGMQERAESIGATLSVQNIRDEAAGLPGTKVELIVEIAGDSTERRGRKID